MAELNPSSSDTCVLRLTNNQDYHLPPENLPITPPKKTKFNRPRVVVTSLILFILILLFGTSFGVFYLALSPKHPKFAISKVLVTHPFSKHPRFHVSLNTNNPNKRMGICVEKGGNASISYKKTKVATGLFPPFDQGDKKSSTVFLILKASNRTLPPSVRGSMQNTTAKLPLALGLTMNVPLRMEIGKMKIWVEEVVFQCMFKVNTLAQGTRVLSQRCSVRDDANK